MLLGEQLLCPARAPGLLLGLQREMKEPRVQRSLIQLLHTIHGGLAGTWGAHRAQSGGNEGAGPGRFHRAQSDGTKGAGPGGLTELSVMDMKRLDQGVSHIPEW